MPAIDMTSVSQREMVGLETGRPVLKEINSCVGFGFLCLTTFNLRVRERAM